VLAAQGSSSAAEEALEKLCRTYWRPTYGFVRRQGVGPEEAKDLTQGFFALLLKRRDLDAVRREKGRLRSYLLTSLKHFLTNERNRAMAIKRGEGQRLIPLQNLRERERVGFEPVDALAADQIYERRWALTVLDQVLARLGDEYRAGGPAAQSLRPTTQTPSTTTSHLATRSQRASSRTVTIPMATPSSCTPRSPRPTRSSSSSNSAAGASRRCRCASAAKIRASS
jgi:DNA-directed RNA polymerase specialized sigma24 family protein